MDDTRKNLMGRVADLAGEHEISCTIAWVGKARKNSKFTLQSLNCCYITKLQDFQLLS